MENGVVKVFTLTYKAFLLFYNNRLTHYQNSQFYLRGPMHKVMTFIWIRL